MTEEQSTDTHNKINKSQTLRKNKKPDQELQTIGFHSYGLHIQSKLSCGDRNHMAFGGGKRK